MIRHLIIEPEAESDLFIAFEWYQEQVIGLGHEFLISIRSCFARIERSPEIYREVIPELRRARVERFPFGIFYVTSEEFIYVVGVFHAKRDPNSWIKRVRSSKRLT